MPHLFRGSARIRLNGNVSTNTSRLLASKRKLSAINGRINSHALNTSPMKEAREVVTEHRGEGQKEVDHALSERGLPSTATQGRALISGLVSLARLNRKRRKLEHRIARLEARKTN